MYKSTRGNDLFTSSQAILKGLAPDGGLFIPETLESIEFNTSWLNLSYQDIAKRIFRIFFDDFTDSEIAEVVSKAYNIKNFPNGPIAVKNFENYSVLELFHGPTMAFKDMALTALPHLMEVAIRKTNFKQKITILTATSGDTGGAALSGFSESENIDIVVIYPNKGVSSFQENQMLSFTNSKAKAFAYDGNFDDCQKMVKDIFTTYKHSSRVLSSANSINIGRLVPQIVYYFAAYCQMVNTNQIVFGEQIDIDVPTGNFGNILAAYYAKKLGLPIRKFICASNQNDVLTQFFNTGVYDSKRSFYKTNSPSMDILVSSNLERLIAHLSNNSIELNSYMSDLKNKGCYKVSNSIFNELECFIGYSVSEIETEKEIKMMYETEDYLVDPHTAVALKSYREIGDKSRKTLIVSTASPFKFSETVLNALGYQQQKMPILALKDITKLDLPIFASKVLDHKKEKIVFTKSALMDYIEEQSFLISVPATTANFGVGFDVVGLSLNLENQFKFIRSHNFMFVGFQSPYDEIKQNLVVQSYLYVCEKEEKEPIPFILELVQQNVPVSRGLGSSATCIVAGVMAFGKLYDVKDKAILLKYMIEIEGHPDNVAPAYLGGMVATYRENDLYHPISYPVSKKLYFMVGSPEYELSTSEARAVLPKMLDYPAVISNLSRIIHLPLALSKGDVSMLCDLLEDRIHQPYRFKLIDDSSCICAFAKEHKLAFCISGAGPSLLVISQNPVDIEKLQNLELKHQWVWRLLRAEEHGARLEELR